MAIYTDISPTYGLSGINTGAAIIGTSGLPETVSTSIQNISLMSRSTSLTGYELEHDQDAIRNSLFNLFIVNKGEVPGKPAFGNPLNPSLFELFDFFNKNDMETAIMNVVEQYEPRITLHTVNIIEAPEYNRIIIQLNYSYVVNDAINYDSLDLPYSHNSISFLGGRIRPPEPASVVGSCVLNI